MTDLPDSTAEEHLSEEDIAAFLEHGLPRKKTEEVVAHLAECPACRILVSRAVQSQKAVRDPKKPRR